MSRQVDPRYLRDRHDPRLEQDMEAELAADVEWFDHPTLGRIRLRDHLVHPPGPINFLSPAAHQHAPKPYDGPVFTRSDAYELAEALDALPDELDDLPQPFYDRRADPDRS